jgi:hypothetical protein
MKVSSGPIKLTIVPAPYNDVFRDIVRVDLRHRKFAKAGRLLIVRCGKCKLRAIARGTLGNSIDSISLDSESRKRLGLKPSGSAEFYFEQAEIVDEFIWAWSASDATSRVAARLGVVSVALGGIGLILGVFSLILALY